MRLNFFLVEFINNCFRKSFNKANLNVYSVHTDIYIWISVSCEIKQKMNIYTDFESTGILVILNKKENFHLNRFSFNLV